MIGIATIATGEKAKKENQELITSIEKHLDIPHITITENNLDYPDHSNMQLSRMAKTNLIDLIPQDWQYCIYLDSDTRVLNSDILKTITILENGFDIVICPSTSQDFWHIDYDEKLTSVTNLGYMPFQYQCGVFAFTVNDTMRQFFLHWSNEYMLYCNQDQMAFVRAIHQYPVKVFLMGSDYNNGKVIRHLFGKTR